MNHPKHISSQKIQNGVFWRELMSLKNTNLKFGGYPITTEKIGDTIYVNVKGVTGTLNEMEDYINAKDYRKRRYFGGSKIRTWKKGSIRIDCLIETRENIQNLISTINKDYNE